MDDGLCTMKHIPIGKIDQKDNELVEYCNQLNLII